MYDGGVLSVSVRTEESRGTYMVSDLICNLETRPVGSHVRDPLQVPISGASWLEAAVLVF
jgi:hypothetical protein